MKRAFRLFVYLSLGFVVLYLIRNGLVELPRIRSYTALLTSLPFLLGGFVAATVAWNRILTRSGFPNRLRECIAGMGLSTFGKYVPGKLWALVGRAAYVADLRGFPLGQLSTVSIKETLLSIWTGLLLGAVALGVAPPLHRYGSAIALVWLLLSAAIFSDRLHEGVERSVGWVLRRPVTIPRLSLRATSAVVPWCLGYWALWSIGFQRLVSALSDGETALHSGLAFPLATVLGNIAVFVPGGLGVREGIIATYLAAVGVAVPEATALSIASRLWFLSGEFCFFVAGVWASRGAARAAG